MSKSKVRKCLRSGLAALPSNPLAAGRARRGYRLSFGSSATACSAPPSWSHTTTSPRSRVVRFLGAQFRNDGRKPCGTAATSCCRSIFGNFDVAIYLVSARKPSFRAEICANSWHPGRDFGTDRRRRRRLTSCGIAKGSKSARMSCFQGQEDRAVSCRLGIQLGYQGRLVRRRVVVVCVPASAGSTRCDAGWPPAPTRQPYARNRPHHGCELGRVPDAPTH